ncbi:MAG: hypothetical protein ABRQ39_02780 [Candidatus Eremiobacterota bacterium]
MTCKEFEEKYLLMLYEELNKDEMPVCTEHMSSCRHCRNLFEETKETKVLFDHMEILEPPDYLLDKVRKEAGKHEFSGNITIKEYIKQIITFLFHTHMRLGFASILLFLIGVTCLINYIPPGHNTINDENNITAIYEEEKLDKDIKHIEVNTASFSDNYYSFGIEKQKTTWNVSSIDSKMTAMEREVKKLKKECESF